MCLNKCIHTRINTYSFIHFEEFKTITIMIMINRTPMLITRINSRMSSALRVWNAALVIHRLRLDRFHQRGSTGSMAMFLLSSTVSCVEFCLDDPLV